MRHVSKRFARFDWIVDSENPYNWTFIALNRVALQAGRKTKVMKLYD